MSEHSSKQYRVELSLDDKVKIINVFEMVPKPMLKSLAKTFDIAKSTVSDIINKCAMYKSEYENQSPGVM